MPALPSYVSIAFDGFNEKYESNLLRTEMEDGLPKQAKIKDKTLVTRSVNLYLSSKADYLSFLEWFKSTLQYGALWFDFTDPVTETVKQARFVGGELKGIPQNAHLANWYIATSIETWS